MSGKNLLVGLSYIDSKYIEESENDMVSGKDSKEAFRIHNCRRPMLVAALIALTALLVGCAVVYALQLQNMKVGETTQSQPVFADDGIHIIGYDDMEYDVLTLAGLKGSNAYKCAQEWYDFKQTYDPNGKIWDSVLGKEPKFPDAYRSYVLYSQEMKDALDAILQKFDLKPVGAALDFRTTRAMCEALGIERILTTDNGVTLRSDSGGCYENGNFWLNLDIRLPEEADVEVTKTTACLYWNRKDCFSSDLLAIANTGDWQEWNYTTASGNEVLIVRSPSDWRGWIICERSDAMMFLRIEARRDFGNNADGKAWWDHYYMTDRQLELVADAIDFSIQPDLVSQADADIQPDVPVSATQNGYTLTLKSVETDGYVARILVGVTAPEGTDIENLNIGTGLSPYEFKSASAAQSWGGGAFNDVADNDGLANTKDLLLVADRHLEDNTMPFAIGSVWNLHIVDLWVDHYHETERLLLEGEWNFSITFDENVGDYTEHELIQEPITVSASVGWKSDGFDMVEDVTISSFKLRKFSATIEHSGEEGSDFSFLNGQPMLAVMKDGSEIQLTGAGSLYKTDIPIDLEKVVHVVFADGTRLYCEF